MALKAENIIFEWLSRGKLVAPRGIIFIKVKKSDWNKILDAFSRAISRNHLLEKYEKKISGLEKKIAVLTDQVEKLKRFVASRSLREAFVEFVRLLAPKTMKQRLEEAKRMRQNKTSRERVARRTL